MTTYYTIFVSRNTKLCIMQEQQEEIKQDFKFLLESKSNDGKFTYECETDFDVLVSALWTVVQDDLFIREAFKVVGDFINEEYFKDA